MPAQVSGMLEAVHPSALYHTPVKDSRGRVVDFRILAPTGTPRPCRDDPPASWPETASPGVAGSGLLDDYIAVYETGEPVYRGVPGR
ncbi:hypothetical protein [Nonomuraea sp. CA-141351]|uniref:hypothetical protein n=1 Tax=Nonomuraea sp. CA-141351 TaxID=3239996 RepID=UPI003D8C9101